MKPGELLRFWFTFERRVGRRDYIVSGIVLMLAKYAVDVLLLWLAAGVLWMPAEYVVSMLSLASLPLQGEQRWLLPALGLWSLPFMWIGISLSLRRALDAGRSAWLAMLFFVPVVNYGLMLLLAALPTATRPPDEVTAPRARERLLPGALLSIAAGAAVGLALVAIGVYALDSYGAWLFTGTPFVVGAVTACLLNRRYPASLGETFEVAAMTILIMGGSMVLLAWEGLLCLAMAAPIGVGAAMAGAVAGRFIALRDPRLRGALALMLLPAGPMIEARQPAAPLREVTSSLVIAASPEAVWRHVVAFRPISEPRSGIFRFGIAAPLAARIEGEGVGAVRYCQFTTGDFVEPIIHWDPPRRLTFTVEEQPPPLVERSLYAHIAAPHLDGYFRTRRGEFRLTPLGDGRTLLEGSSWYELRIFPAGYWSLIADPIVRRIHERVLRHIGREATGSAAPADHR